jgi:hypothetical protein
MGLVNEQFEFLKDVSRLISFIEHYCFITPEADVATAGEMHRPQATQEYYVSVGLSGTLDGQHPKRLAIDINYIREGKLVGVPEVVGKYWESLNFKNVWGGRWKKPYDPGHFERRP